MHTRGASNGPQSAKSRRTYNTRCYPTCGRKDTTAAAECIGTPVVLLLGAGVSGFQCKVIAVDVRYVGWQVLFPEGRVDELSIAGGSL